MTTSFLDENDRLQRGEVPDDPRQDAEPMTEPPKRTRVALADGDHGAAVLPHLVTKNNGEVRPLVANILTVFARDARWAGVIAYDAFRECPIVQRQPPQRTDDALERVSCTPWTSQDATRTAAWLLATYGLDVSSGQVEEAMAATAEKRTIHPVREYLDGLTWDGVARLDRFFTDYCGVADSPYARGVARLLLLSAVARVRKPGCKVDTIPVLEGEQGEFKSTLLSVLAGAWFADTPLDLGDKDAYQVLKGVWIFELGELAALKGRDATRIKSFASSPSDTYRPSYARRAVSVPRQCIFVGTTNESQYLVDVTGARRFWPVRVGRIDLDAVRHDRDQLWAEASVRIAAGETWWPSRDLDRMGIGEQADRFEGDPWDDAIAAWLASPHRIRFGADGSRHEDRLDPSEGIAMADVLAHARVAPTAPTDLIVLTWDPETQVAELATDSVLLPGLALTDTRWDGTITVRDLEQTFTAEGARAKAFCSGNLTTRVANALRTFVEELSGIVYVRKYRYRVVSQGTDGRLTLQAVAKTAGVPDQMMISPYYGAPGVSAKVTPGALCLVEFAEGDPTLPLAVSFDATQPIEVDVSAATLVKITAAEIDLTASGAVKIAGNEVDLNASTIKAGGSSAVAMAGVIDDWAKLVTAYINGMAPGTIAEPLACASTTLMAGAPAGGT